jgi:hypothetical protein
MILPNTELNIPTIIDMEKEKTIGALETVLNSLKSFLLNVRMKKTRVTTQVTEMAP